MVENHIREKRPYDEIQGRIYNTFQWTSTTAAKKKVFEFLDINYEGDPWSPEFEKHLHEIKNMLYNRVSTSEASIKRLNSIEKPDCSKLPDTELSVCQKVGYLQKAKAAYELFKTEDQIVLDCLEDHLNALEVELNFYKLGNLLQLVGQVLLSMLGLLFLVVVPLAFLILKFISHISKADALSNVSMREYDEDEVSKYWGKAVGYGINIVQTAITAGTGLANRRKMKKMRKFK